jgi:hypothetical protein
MLPKGTPGEAKKLQIEGISCPAGAKGKGEQSLHTEDRGQRLPSRYNS